MTYEMSQREPFSAIGVEIRTSNENAREIGVLWNRFVTEDLAGRIPSRSDEAIVAAYCEYEGDHTRPYTFFLGCAVGPDAEPPEGMTKREIPGGTFAAFVADGPMPQALMETWGRIWASPVVRAFGTDYELHEGDGQPVLVYVGTT